MVKAERTLVKSRPEVWEYVRDPETVDRWSGEILGAPGGRIVAEHEGNRLVWRGGGGCDGTIELRIDERGWGTSVSIRARGGDAREPVAERALERMLDEISAPQRRPFERS